LGAELPPLDGDEEFDYDPAPYDPGAEIVATEELEMNPASPERQKQFLNRWFRQGTVTKMVGDPRSAMETSAFTGGGYESLDSLEFLAVGDSSAPFHVIDSGPNETFMVELPEGTVGRNHGSGDHWAWVELDSGLMGLIRKKHLRGASTTEIGQFESGAGGAPARSSTPRVSPPEPVQMPTPAAEPPAVMENDDAPIPVPPAPEMPSEEEYSDSVRKVLESLP
ncbi:MAG: hypothetical protein AAF191_20060, partial [Verrucomicrobiota bacterium]